MTTKDQERKALEQIKKIVAGLGENSYIGMAFDGAFTLAETNIENDFGESAQYYIDKANSLEGELKAARTQSDEKIESIKKELELTKETLKQEGNRARKYVEEYRKACDTSTEYWNKYREMEDKNEALALENMKLKAKLYDMMMAAAE